MKAILLAGGLGTRLRSVVADRPKPMADVNGKPFAEYLVHALASQGIREITFAVGYLGEMIEEYFGDGSKFGVKARYAYEKELLGTAGAIKNAAKAMDPDFDRVLVLNADTFYAMDYSRCFSCAEERNLDMALVLREVPDIRRYGEAVLEEGILTGFNEKSGEERRGTINGGVYCITEERIDAIPDGKVSLENEMIPLWMKEGRKIGGYVEKGYFIDIGVPEDYARFGRDAAAGKVIW